MLGCGHPNPSHRGVPRGPAEGVGAGFQPALAVHRSCCSGHPGCAAGGKRGDAAGLRSSEVGWPSLARTQLQPVFGNTMCCRNRGSSAFFYGLCLGFFFHFPPPPSLNSGVIPGINLALACIISTVFIMGFFCAEQLDFLFGCLILPHLLHCDG